MKCGHPSRNMRLCKTVFILSVMSTVIWYLYRTVVPSQGSRSIHITRPRPWTHYQRWAHRDMNDTNFVTALNVFSDSQQTVIIFLVDSGYMEQTFNFYEGSIQKLGIRNYLPVCIDHKASQYMKVNQVYCYQYLHLAEGAETSNFGSEAFHRKTNIKTKVVLQAIKLGFTVLMTDVDVVFLKNPLPFFTCKSCDVHVQMDLNLRNSGFVFVRPTQASITLYKTAWDDYEQYRRSHDQSYFNKAFMIMDNRNQSIQVQELSRRRFVCGHYFFISDARMFLGLRTKPCPECVTIHNNYMGSAAGKMYRLRENLLWVFDHHQYYTKPNRKYIVYDNPIDWGDITRNMEIKALKSALAIGHILNRTVILPKFHCCYCDGTLKNKCENPRVRCSLLTITRLRVFDKQFKERYRENSFLFNRKVPIAIKMTAHSAPSLLIKTNFYNDQNENTKVKNMSSVFIPSNPEKGATSAEILEWFSILGKQSVIKFHSLYGAFGSFTDERLDRKFKLRLDNAFECAPYEQWEASVLDHM